jgi:hypothetical protein
VIMPVTYVQDGDSVVFRAPLDAGFVAACDRAVIAFEVGDVDCDDGAWSVHVVGIASMVTVETARVDLERVSGRQLCSVSMPACSHIDERANECRSRTTAARK